MDIPEMFHNAVCLARGVFKKIKIDKCGKLLRAEKGVRIINKNAEINIGRKVFLHRDVKLSAFGTKEARARLTIGDNSYIGDRTEIHAGKSVKIGSNVNISWNCNILDRDYHKFESDTERIEETVIENNVWICSGVTILKGVTIGEGAVVAAGSVVTHDVPPRTLVGGNPAKVIRENITWKP